MPVRSNGYFNNPAFAQAAQNLSSLFEPPSGADAAGWANADAKRAEAQRLADFFTNSTTLDTDAYDRQGAALGIFNPNAGFGARNMDDATKRYGYDTQATTSRANNADDNSTAIQTNKLDNLTDLFGPVSQDAMRPEIPANIADMYGVPNALPEVQGNRSPLSETQLNAQTIQGMPQELREAIAFGSTPVENIVTPEGPRIQTRLDSIGEQPYAKETPGMSVTLPDGTVVQQGGKTTEAENKMAFAGSMAEGASNDLVTAFDTPGGLPGDADYQLFNLMRNTPLAAHPAIVRRMSGPAQVFYQNLRVALPYQLMAKSGLAVTEQEYARTLAELVPVPGEDPGVTDSKRRQFATFVSTIQGLSGQAWAKAKMNPPAPPPQDAATGAPAAPAPASPAATPRPGGEQYPEGTVISNGQTQMVRRGGKWEPM